MRNPLLLCMLCFVFSVNLLPTAPAYTEPTTNTQLPSTLEEKQKQADQRNDPKLYFALSEEYAANNKPHLALKAINKAITLDPNNIQYLTNRGIIAYWINDLPLMKQTYSKILQLDPNNATAMLGLARALSGLQQYPSAMDYYKKYLEKKPKDGDAIIELANVQNWSGQYDAAKATLEQYKTQFGETEKYKQALRSLVKPEQKAPQQLPQTKTTATSKPAVDNIEALKAKIAKNPKNAQLYFQLSEEYGAKNQPKPALIEIKKAIELDPNNFQYLTNQAILANWVDDLPLMEKSYRAILKQKPNTLTAQIGLARALSRQSKYKEATPYYEKYLQASPKDKEAQKEFVQIAIWSNDLTAASKRLENYKKLVGDTSEYKKLSAEIKKAKALSKPSVSPAEHPTSIADLLRLTKRHPNNAAHFVALSQAYSSKDKPKQALAAINKAVMLDPSNLQYLYTKIKLAYWADDMEAMKQGAKQIMSLKPNDPDALLALARVSSRRGQYTQSAIYYKKYLHYRPSDQQSWLDSVDIQIWQENFRQANHILCEYRKHFGETTGYLSRKARMYASAQWFDHALAINTPLVEKYPKNYYYHSTQAIAHRYAYLTDEAQLSLAELYTLDPTSDETDFMNLFVNLPAKSHIDFGGNYLFDSQTVNLWQAIINAYYYFTPETYLVFRLMHEQITATIFSGLAPVTGGLTTYDDTAEVGIYHRINPYVAIEGGVGALTIHKRSSFVIYNGKAEFKLGDRALFSYEYLRDLFRPDLFAVFSPRSVSLQIIESAHQFHLYATPGLNTYLNFYGTYLNLSDGNRSWEAVAWPSTAIVRYNSLKIDMGFYANLYSFRFRFDNGYYSPLFAQLYLVTFQLYYGISTNTGLSLNAGFGAVRDETFNTFKFASDVGMSIVNGFYKNWQFAFQAGYSSRGDSTINIPNRTYHVASFNILVTRRI